MISPPTDTIVAVIYSACLPKSHMQQTQKLA